MIQLLEAIQTDIDIDKIDLVIRKLLEFCITAGRHILIAAIAAVNNATAVGLKDSIIFKCRTARHQMRFISFRKFHSHTKGNQFEFSRF